MSDHCEGCVGCEVDGVPISEATWLDWPWLKRRAQPLVGRTRWPRHGAADGKDPGPDVRVDSIGRRYRRRRGHPPTSGPATETLSGTYAAPGSSAWASPTGAAPMAESRERRGRHDERA